MGKALYRKHRPKKLSEMVGQDHITATLDKAIKTGRISHAYLFTGPRGTGKTTTARILAHEVNKLPYNEDETHLDIIEIDAASNRRIDEIRELKDRINIAPTSAPYKVYIIDEVHMLTREAFNALLKTLEEPPEHAIFILATTEAHKLPETIISRTQRFSFKPYSLAQLTQQLKTIAKKEKLKIDDDAIELIARHGNGSFRDSISLLDQVGNTSDRVSQDDIRQALGQAPEELLQTLLDTLHSDDIAAVAQALQSAQDSGIQPAQLAEQLSQEIRRRMLGGQPVPSRPTALLRELMAVPTANNPHIALELALYEAMLDRTPGLSQPSSNTQLSKAATLPAKTMPIPSPLEEVKKPAPVKHSEPEPTPDTPTEPVDMDNAIDAPTQGDWQDILDAIKAKHNTLYGIIRMASPQFQPGSIVLSFSFPFHHKRVSDAKNHAILTKIAAETTGQQLRISYELNTVKSQPVAETVDTPPVDLGAITEVFGKAEVLD